MAASISRAGSSSAAGGLAVALPTRSCYHHNCVKLVLHRRASGSSSCASWIGRDKEHSSSAGKLARRQRRALRTCNSSSSISSSSPPRREEHFTFERGRQGLCSASRRALEAVDPRQDRVPLLADLLRLLWGRWVCGWVKEGERRGVMCGCVGGRGSCFS
jgi:hypothetical protein